MPKRHVGPYPTRRRNPSGLFTIRIPKDLHAKLADIADSNLISLSRMAACVVARHAGWVEGLERSDRNLFANIRMYLLADHEIRDQRWQAKELAHGIDQYMRKRYGAYPKAASMRPAPELTDEELDKLDKELKEQNRLSRARWIAGQPITVLEALTAIQHLIKEKPLASDPVESYSALEKRLFKLLKEVFGGDAGTAKAPTAGGSGPDLEVREGGLP